MSTDRRPAKVRVVSSDAGEPGDVALAPAPAPGTPARRRGDKPQEELALGVSGEQPGAPDARTQGASIGWAFGAILLFLIGCALGGGLLMLSGLVSVTDL